MAKKKITEKLRLQYRGPSAKPRLIADDAQMKIISTTLEECFAQKDRTLTIQSGQNRSFKMIVGLSSGLRSLKQGRSEMIIYDDTAGVHLSNYLNYYSCKKNIPIIQAHGLIDLAPKFNFKTLLMISFVKTEARGVEESATSDSLARLYELMTTKLSKDLAINLQPPVLETVVCTNKSQQKKEIKKKKKDSKEKKENDIEKQQT